MIYVVIRESHHGEFRSIPWYLLNISMEVLVYFLNNKLEVLQMFKESRTMVEGQSGNKIKVLRLDSWSRIEIQRLLLQVSCKLQTTNLK